jgi:hypothetical protein
LDASCLPYFALSECFNKRDDPKAFENELTKRLDMYKADKTWGLVKKIAKVYREPLRFRLVELADTYLTVGNKEIDVSGQEGQKPSELGPTLFQMIADNQVKAKIDAKQQMISFIDAAAT